MPKAPKRHSLNRNPLIKKHVPTLPEGYDKRRGSAAKRGYDATWRRMRAMHLHRHPLCVDCKKAGRVTAATDVDHIKPLREGGARLDPANLQSLCHSCHSRKTARGQ